MTVDNNNNSFLNCRILLSSSVTLMVRCCKRTFDQGSRLPGLSQFVDNSDVMKKPKSGSRIDTDREYVVRGRNCEKCLNMVDQYLICYTCWTLCFHVMHSCIGIVTLTICEVNSYSRWGKIV